MRRYETDFLGHTYSLGSKPPAQFNVTPEVTLLPMRIDVRMCDLSYRGLAVSVDVYDRETRRTIDVTFVESMDPRFIDDCKRDPMLMAKLIRMALMKVMEHEIGELLLIRGERLFDPHHGEAVYDPGFTRHRRR